MIYPLPSAFAERMKNLLPKQFPAFMQSYEQAPYQGLRLHLRKTDVDTFHKLAPFTLRPIPWCTYGFYYPEAQRPGKHPYHAAGLYYLQEPSAMAVADMLEVEPGDIVLDLCAAPGGKSTQLAAAMQGKGLLIANEIHPTRAKALSENIERLGITNAIVTNEHPDKLVERFPQFFDRILVDAPCSGEGMFRKLPEAINDWSEAKVRECHHMQTDILACAAHMLKPGGTLVYSTCTFAPLENEQSISDFMERYPAFTLLPLENAARFAQGQPAWGNGNPDLTLTARLWPHLLEGEGHYMAKLRKITDDDRPDGRDPRSKAKARPTSSVTARRKEAVAAWQSFALEAMPAVLHRTHEETAFQLFGEQLYYSPAPSLDLSGLKIVRAGWHLGTVKKNRFEPSHALALALVADEVVRRQEFTADDPLVLKYLRGESLSTDGKNGWTLVTIDGYSLGFGKQVDGQLKNHYPKGLRWL